MSYSDLLARQQKELEQLNQNYYADQATVKILQKEHYDRNQYDGQLGRLQESHERLVKEVQARFVQEQREYLGEPTPPPPLPDISQSQDKAVNMMKAHRQQQSESRTIGQQNATSEQQTKQSQAVDRQSVDEAEIKKLAQQARKKREEKKPKCRRGFKR